MKLYLKGFTPKNAFFIKQSNSGAYEVTINTVLKNENS